MSGDVHVRFWEGAGVRFPRATHLPLHRLERSYERQGVFLHRSTLCDWLGACAGLLRPLYDLMVRMVLQSRALHTDDTTVKMQELVTHLSRDPNHYEVMGHEPLRA
jgi:hypothetical protein